MFKRSLILLTVLSLIFILSCEQNTIVFPKVCTEEPDFPFRKVRITFETDSLTEKIITLDNKGYLYGDSIIIKQNGIQRNARIVGVICKDLILNVNIVFNDPGDKSQMKIQGNVSGNIARADIFYCPNTETNCNFVKIGDFYGSYAGGSGAGHFTTPLFTGLFRYGSGD